ncbi:hypothetical protein ONS96_008612 [Cadophora gregata f. sp. sojae]|nr:hypothetical protein ONS96_008612 [Cadophora gregata f. sp. sojae]
MSESSVVLFAPVQTAEETISQSVVSIKAGARFRTAADTWKDSHLANKTERELSEICSRREMTGYGSKAAMLKWLDMGRIDHQDMYMDGLTRICGQRGVDYKESDKKADLVRRPNEADEAEGSG